MLLKSLLGTYLIVVRLQLRFVPSSEVCSMRNYMCVSLFPDVSISPSVTRTLINQSIQFQVVTLEACHKLLILILVRNFTDFLDQAHTKL